MPVSSTTPSVPPTLQSFRPGTGSWRRGVERAKQEGPVRQKGEDGHSRGIDVVYDLSRIAAGGGLQEDTLRRRTLHSAIL